MTSKRMGIDWGGWSNILGALLLGCALISTGTWAQTPPAPREAKPMANNPTVEARLVDISQELRCMVCQNESLASSHAELAEDLRREVRDLIVQGKTDSEIKTFLVDRYGDFVLYRPEVKPLTWALWFGPFFLLLLAAFALGAYLRQRKQQVAPAELSDAQRERAEQLLRGKP
jgi:cytochrome c-type biogenesis protein CcmH